MNTTRNDKKSERVSARSALAAVPEGARSTAETLGVSGIVDALRRSSQRATRLIEFTVFHGGKYDTRGGERMALPLPEVARELEETAELVFEKGTGPYMVPGISRTGGCRDADYETTTLLALDCDGAGDWDLGLERLRHADVSYLVQRSVSHSIEQPKFHLFIPIEPFRVEKAVFRKIYRFSVVLLAYLFDFALDTGAVPPKLGFDHATDRLLQPMFCATRRAASDAVPATAYFVGCNLDLLALLNRLGFDPAFVEPRHAQARRRRRSVLPPAATEVSQGALQVAFAVAGMSGGSTLSGALKVLCPWREQHTTGSDFDGATVVFPPRPGLPCGVFHCSHTHCTDRRQREVLLSLPERALRVAFLGGPL